MTEAPQKETNIYTEKGTGIIHVVKMLGDYVLIRPVSVDPYLTTKKLPLGEFAERFEEYIGDYEQINRFIRGEPDPQPTQDTSHLL